LNGNFIGAGSRALAALGEVEMVLMLFIVAIIIAVVAVVAATTPPKNWHERQYRSDRWDDKELE